MSIRPPYKLCLSIAFFCTVFVFSLNAQSLKGKIVDAKTGEPLIGATVLIKNGEKQYKTQVNLDGTYNFKKVTPGDYAITVTLVGYEPINGGTAQVASSGTSTASFQLNEATASLEEVKVNSTRNAESQQTAIRLEKNSDFVQNVMSAKAIELSPDVTVSNSLQRMSGVSFQSSNSGEGRYAIIRGMDQRYNSTLVNGVQIPSPDDRFRYVPMNIFPADIIQRLEVIKALTPSMEGNAIGGVMNLVMKDAPKREEFKVFAAGGGNTLFSSSRPYQGYSHSDINKQSPYEISPTAIPTDSSFPKSNLKLNPKNQPFNLQTGLTYGNRFLKNKLGVVVSLSYQNLYRGDDQFFIIQDNKPQVIQNANGIAGNTIENSPQFLNINNSSISIQQQRYGINNKIDYSIDKNNKLSLFNFFVAMDEYQTRLLTTTDINANPGLVTINTRTFSRNQNIYNSTLHGEHNITSAFTANWTAAYSRARQDLPDLAQYSVQNQILFNQNSQDSALKYNSDTPLVKSMSRSWSHNTDQDIAGYVNFIYKHEVLHRMVEFSVGGMYRHKTRDNFYRTYSLSTSNSPQLNNIDSINFAFKLSSGDEPQGDPGFARNYSITENVAGNYLQIKFMATDKLQVLGGARFEATDQNYTTDLSTQLNAKTGHIYYTDFLPSIHFKYALDRKQNIRASYFRSLVRPGFAEIIPSKIVASETEAYDQQGNPYLQHTTADNYDVRYELFPKIADVLLVGGFIKDLHNPIEVVFSHFNVTGGNSSTGLNILTPSNVGDVINYGAEFLATKYFGKFGVSANYTYTHSATTTPKSYYGLDAVSHKDTTTTVNQTRPLQGQAAHIGNISLLFKDHKLGLDMQLAYVYTGERIQLVNSFYNLDTWQSPFGQLDFSFTKKIIKKLEVYGKVINILNEKTNYFIKHPYYSNVVATGALPNQTDPSNKIFVQNDQFKTSYLVGFRYRL